MSGRPRRSTAFDGPTSRSRTSAKRPRDADLRLRVRYLVAFDHPLDVGDGERLDVEHLVIFGLRIAGDKALRDVEVQELGTKAGRGVERPQLAERFATVAGLFEQFAARGDGRVFVAVELAGWDLPQ